ncbi:MAG TPA: hypothetical protein VFG39_00345, partial [Balneolaceae bacterium]|nr:hypothetical protein [Balneolaceae bacterium]
MQNWSELIFTSEVSFQEKAQKIFEYQFENNLVYRRYCQALKGTNSISEILKQVQNDKGGFPLLPIRAFQDAEITTQPGKKPDLIFKSSGTSRMQSSAHRVMDASMYKKSLFKGFQQFYDLESAVIWGYMPIYENNPHSSLIYMMQELIFQDESGLSRFLRLDEALNPNKFKELQEAGK